MRNRSGYDEDEEKHDDDDYYDDTAGFGAESESSDGTGWNFGPLDISGLEHLPTDPRSVLSRATDRARTLQDKWKDCLEDSLQDSKWVIRPQ